MTEFPLLGSPLSLGPQRLRNRVVFAAHLTNYAEDGLPSERHIGYYAARARGGAGLVIVEEQTVLPGDRPYEKMIEGWRDEALDGYRKLTDAVHAEGAVVLAQINHNGGQSSGMYSRAPVWAPSPIPDPLFREVPTEITTRQIDELVCAYADVAARCVAGGFDGLEVQCSQSSILRGFLARASNTRSDGYGGSLEGRARLLLDVVGAIRAATGPDAVIGVRLPGDEHFAGGVELGEAVDVAVQLAESGAVDYLNTSIGMATRTLHLIEASMAVPPGYANHIPAAIRRAVTLPVVGVGRFTAPQQAEDALAEGICDLVGVVRGQIADPEFAGKALSGRAEEIRECLSCNQECVGRTGLGRWLGCLENPTAGKEFLPVPEVRHRGRRVCVVGAGPAGLQAAVTAAERGHRVTLFERDTEVGGQVRLAARAPSRAQFGLLVTNLRSQCGVAGVEVRTGVDVDVGLLLAAQPDAVVVATGARAISPGWANGSARVQSAREVVAAEVAGEASAAPMAGERVLVVDELGFHPATAVAELLALRGCLVTICTPAMVVGQDLGLTLDMESWQRRVRRLGVRQTTDVVVMALAERADGVLDVHLVHHPTGRPVVHTVDRVVAATHQEPVDDLWKQLADSSFEVHRVGDAVTPRRAHAAVIEGHRVGATL